MEGVATWHLGPSKEPVILHEIEMTLYDATSKSDCNAGAVSPAIYLPHVVILC